MLSAADVEKDYEALMESAERLRTEFPQWDGWPREGFTIEENLRDLQKHQREFEQREAFAYTVVSLDESRVLGCVYLYPSPEETIDAEVLMWVREQDYHQGLSLILYSTVRDWISEAWPFQQVTYPNWPELT